MAIITPLKKIFNWQTASEKIPYKVYTALLTQTGTNAPVATVLENTLGETLVWLYDGIGSYYAEISANQNKIVCFGTGNRSWSGSINSLIPSAVTNGGNPYPNSMIYLSSYTETAGVITPANDWGDQFCSIEIRVYN